MNRKVFPSNKTFRNILFGQMPIDFVHSAQNLKTQKGDF